MKQYVLIRRLRIHAANAISGPLTYGLPSITAYLGFGHALQRNLTLDTSDDRYRQFRVHGVGVVVHQMQMLEHRERFERTLRITANPVDEKGNRPSFVEEGRCHMTVSLVLQVSGLTRGKDFADDASRVVQARMKLAGGDIQCQPQVELVSDDRSTIRKLMPGYALMDRRSMLRAEMENQNDDQDGLDALHQLIAVHSSSRRHLDDEGNETVVWDRRRRQSGWIVPISVGYQGITSLESTDQTRDSSTPHRFAEAVTSLGEFVMVSRVDSLAELIWRYEISKNLYLAVQEQIDQPTSTIQE